MAVWCFVLFCFGTRKDLCSNKVLKLIEWMCCCPPIWPHQDQLVNSRVKIETYKKAFLSKSCFGSFRKMQSSIFDFVLKGSQYLLSQYNHKIFPSGTRSAVYQAWSLPPADTLSSLKNSATVSDAVASGKVNSTDGVKYGFSFPLNSPASNRGQQIVEGEYGRKVHSFSLFPFWIHFKLLHHTY